MLVVGSSPGNEVISCGVCCLCCCIQELDGAVHNITIMCCTNTASLPSKHRVLHGHGNVMGGVEGVLLPLKTSNHDLGGETFPVPLFP